MVRYARLLSFASVVGLIPVSVPASGIDPELLAGMKARSIGPAGMSGRVAAIDAVASDPSIVYVGAATGGVWKSVNAGLTWTPVFDDQPVASIGALAIFQPSPDIVWVGTGEGNPRNSVSVGNGVYRSLDGGKTWAHLGLEGTERIHRIALHPSDPEVAYVAAMGKAWGENPERGIFKTVDGGKSWRKVLYVDEKTGAADLVMDPSNPEKLLAAMWDYRRWPWFFRSGGPGSGIHVTVDGGAHWTKLTPEDGLPEGELGRIGLAISRSHASVVYAFVEAKKENALYVSKDGGWNWKLAGKDSALGNRPFYYADIRVDPEWPDRVYSLWSSVSVSDDGGRSFRLLVPFREIHPDHHAMWIHPEHPEQIMIGNDGGVAFSDDRGESWRFVRDLPLAQFYHVAVDLDTPYNVYGGLQDNGSWRGPASVWENGGIRNHHWEEVGFGDGFDTLPHPKDSLTGYAMSQQGFLLRWDLRTGERKDIRPPEPDGVPLRFNWNAGIAIDPFEPDTVYYGSQFLHRSRDRGDTWGTISGDLTTNNPEWQKQAESGGLTLDVTGAENFTTIVAVAPSPIQRGLIWVGTDDGRIHLTRDGGVTWTSVEANLKGVPQNTWVPHIEPSKYDDRTAFVVLDDHRRSNWTPYVFRTRDHGKTWQSLATPNLRGYCLAIEQDPVKEDLLYLGTEFGLYVSLDGGSSWMPWTHGVPTVSVMDLVVHPREHDLVMGTHGRSLLVLDDVRALRTLSEAAMQEPVHLFEIPPAQQYRVKQTAGPRFPGHEEFRGENRPYGAIVTYALNAEGLPHPDPEKEKLRKEQERKAGKAKPPAGEPGESKPGAQPEKKGPQAKITVCDAQGRVVRTLEAPATQGVNRAVWDLRRDAFEAPPREEPAFREPRGTEVLPGDYEATVAFGGHEAKGRVLVLPDPRFAIPQADRQAKEQAVLRAGSLLELVAEAVKRIQQARSEVDVVLAKVKAESKKDAGSPKGDASGDVEEGPHKPLAEAGSKLKKTLDEIEKRLWVPPGTKGVLAPRDALSRIQYALRSLDSSWDAPTPAQESYLHQAQAHLEQVLAEVNREFAEDVAGFKRLVAEAGMETLGTREPLAVPK